MMLRNIVLTNSTRITRV